MKTSRLLLIASVLSLAACASQNSFKYQTTEDKSTTIGRAGQNLSMEEEGVKVQFRAPDGWKIVSCMDEPLDWDFAANAPKDPREFGVIVRKDEAHATTKGRYQSYLANVHAHYDPKVRMTPEAPFTLSDGRSITPYRFSSEYWKERLVIIIPEGKAVTVFEFTAPTQEFLKSSRELIQKMLGSYKRVK